MTKSFEQTFEELFPQPKDQRVYLISPLVTAVAQGKIKLDTIQRKKLSEFPKLIELLEYVATSERCKNLTKLHISFGPEATVDAAAGELLRLEQAIDNGDYEKLDFNDRHSAPQSKRKQVDVSKLVNMSKEEIMQELSDLGQEIDPDAYVSDKIFNGTKPIDDIRKKNLQLLADLSLDDCEIVPDDYDD